MYDELRVVLVAAWLGIVMMLAIGICELCSRLGCFHWTG